MRATAPPPSELSISISSGISHQQTPNMNGNASKISALVAPPTPNAATINNPLDFSQLEEHPQAHQTTQQQIDEISRNYAKMNLFGGGGARVGSAMPFDERGAGPEEEVAETSQFCHALKERVCNLGKFNYNIFDVIG